MKPFFKYNVKFIDYDERNSGFKRSRKFGKLADE